MSSGKSAAKRAIRTLTAHEKLDAIRRVHEGESKASVARDIGVPESTLRGWCKNEEKISYLSRQSSPESNDDGEPKEKRMKLEEPYNLSMKANYRQDLTKSEMEVAKTIADLSTKMESQKTSNRDELVKLSLKFGLDRQEVFPSLGAVSNDPLGNMILQWNHLMLQQQQFVQQPPQPKKIKPAVDVSCSTVSTTEQKPPQLPNQERIPSVDESVSYWLRAQQAVMMASQIPTTTTSAPVSSDRNGHSWFWKWYKQFANDQTTSVDKPILYQQLTKSRDVENIEHPASKSPTRSRAVLDNLLVNNNNNNVSTEKRRELSEVEEALLHGEKFLKWLETCSEPSVSTVQLMQFRTLLNNVKSSVDRKNGDVQNLKTKVKRK